MGTKEFFDCRNTLEEDRRDPPFYALQGRPIRIQKRQYPHGKSVEILPLSPTDFQFDNFLKNVNKFAAETSNQPEPLVKYAGTLLSRKRNNLSVVTLITIGKNSILLGADMEEKSNKNFGWKNIFEHQRNEEPRPFLIKVPHHGSVGAYSKILWSDYIAKKPISVVTAFSRSRLPNKSGKELLKKNSKKVFIVGKKLPLNNKNNLSYGNEVPKKHRLNVSHTQKPPLSKFGSVVITFNAKSKIITSKSNLNSNLKVKCFGNAQELLKI